MGAKKGLELPAYPQALTAKAGSESVTKLPSGPTCKDALHDLPNADKFQALLQNDEVQTEAWGKPSLYAHELRCLDRDAWHYGYPRIWNPQLLTSSARTEHSAISQLRFEQTEPGSVEPISRFFKLSPAGVSNTLRAGTDASRGAFTSPRPIHYRFARCVTVREMARLHGFPDWFRFHRTKWHGARQIGNSVPPPLARAVASSVIAAMGISPTSVRDAILLGHPALLAMDMSQAAFHLEVEVPIQKRDRKSGVRKRTQLQTEIERLSQFEMQIR
jgi:DNA (cytosine-5)-methyltransferase 1